MNLNENQKKILTILDHITANTRVDGLSAAELAQEVGIAKVNINKNLNALREGGYPIRISKWEMTQGRARPLYAIKKKGQRDAVAPKAKSSGYYTKRVYYKHQALILAKLRARKKPCGPWDWLLLNAR